MDQLYGKELSTKHNSECIKRHSLIVSPSDGNKYVVTFSFDLVANFKYFKGVWSEILIIKLACMLHFATLDSVMLRKWFWTSFPLESWMSSFHEVSRDIIYPGIRVY